MDARPFTDNVLESTLMTSLRIFAHRHLSRNRGEKFLSLEEFIFRRKVLETYRALMRVVYRSHERHELAKYARDEFRSQAREQDLSHRKYLLLTGIKKIDDTLRLLGMSSVFK